MIHVRTVLAIIILLISGSSLFRNLVISTYSYKITSINNQTCEKYGDYLYLKQNITVNNCRDVILDCGLVKNCHPESCPYYKIKLNNRLTCYQSYYNDFICDHVWLGVTTALLCIIATTSILYLCLCEDMKKFNEYLNQ